MCRTGEHGRADITDSNLHSQKQLDIKPGRIYYIRYDIMGEMGNSFNLKKPLTIRVLEKEVYRICFGRSSA